MTRFIKQAMNGEDITINGDGLQTRTFCYIGDNIEATIKCMNHDFFINEVINIGSDYEVTILELAKIIIEVTGSNSIISHKPALKQGDMKRRKPDISKMKLLMNREMVSLREGIRLVYLDFLNK